jgi:DNA-binding transcriptional ArsR family regulator
LTAIEEVFSSKGRVRILRILAKMGELNISEIVRRTELNHLSAERHLTFLKDAGLIVEKRYGRIRIFELNGKDERLKAIMDLFRSWENF